MNSNDKSFSIHGILYENRYCNQEGFSVLFCGGKDKNNNCLNRVFEMKLPSFEVTKFASMVKPRVGARLVVVDSDVMAIGGGWPKHLRKSIIPVEIYFNKIKFWQLQYIQIEEKYCFCLCFFMKKLFVIEGWVNSSNKTLSS